MIQIRYAEASDRKFWYQLDRLLSDIEFENKVRRKQGYDNKVYRILSSVFMVMGLIPILVCPGSGFGDRLIFLNKERN